MVAVNDADVYRGMVTIIKNVITPMTCVIKGLENPSISNVQEWIQFEMLATKPNVARRTNFYQHYAFQLICFSLQANLRDDKRADRHYELADIYKPFLHLATHHIKSSCISFQEARISYLDLRTATFTAKNISTGGTPSLDTLCSVIIAEASIDQPR